MSIRIKSADTLLSRPHVYLLLLSMLSLGAAHSQTKGTEFWVGFMENLDILINEPPEFQLNFSTYDQPANFTVYNALGTTLTSGYIPPNSLKEVVLPYNLYYSLGSEEVDNLGLRIETTAQVTLVAHHNRQYFSDASLIYPTTFLDTSYTVLTYYQKNSLYTSKSQLNVVATEDSTQVEIALTGISMEGYGPGNPIKVWLNRGENFQVQSYQDLCGTRVRSENGKAVAVFAGCDRTVVGCEDGSEGFADNHIWSQVLGDAYAGQVYPMVPFANQAGHFYRILATQDNTVVSFDCKQSVAQLNAGEFVQLDTIRTPKILYASAPVVVAQFNESQHCHAPTSGDPAFSVLLPLSHRTRQMNLEFNPDIQTEGGWSGVSDPVYAVNIVVRTSNVGALKFDNQLRVDSFQVFPNAPQWSYYVARGDTGFHSIASDEGFYAINTGFAPYNAYVHAVGTDSIVPLSIDIPTAYLDEDTALCRGDTMTLTIYNYSSQSNYIWYSGMVNDSSQLVWQTGNYYFTETRNGCRNSDSIHVLFQDTAGPIRNLDTIICEGEVIVVPDSMEVNYLWQSGQSGSIEITSSGSYIVTVSSVCGPTFVDTVKVIDFPSPEVNLPDRTFYCQGSSVDVNVDLAFGETAIWSTGEEASSILVDSVGVYTVKVRNAFCQIDDTIRVDSLVVPKVSLSESGYSCFYNGLALNVPQDSATNYQWNTGHTGNSLPIVSEGEYWVHVSNVCGESRDTVDVRGRFCQCEAFVPNTFSPDHSGINDEFFPVFSCPIESMEMWIFSRYYKEVFYTNDPNGRWDGRSREHRVVNGVYGYMIKYKPKGEEVKELKGVIAVIGS